MGIVIPSPAQWLLPEIQDIAKTLQTTLQLPPDATVGHGITLEPTSDGILINLPTGRMLTLPLQPAYPLPVQVSCLNVWDAMHCQCPVKSHPISASSLSRGDKATQELWTIAFCCVLLLLLCSNSPRTLGMLAIGHISMTCQG